MIHQAQQALRHRKGVAQLFVLQINLLYVTHHVTGEWPLLRACLGEILQFDPEREK